MANTRKAVLASVAAVSMAAFAPLSTAAAQEGDAVITNTETVNVTLDPSGNVEVARLYDQIAIQGSGEVGYANPVSTEALRNLDEFGGFTVEGEDIVETTSVDGQLRRRALADFDKELPITISATYTLDGQAIDPADLVGKSGTVEAVFRVENMTGAEEEITFADGTGGVVTKTAMVYDPYGGSLAFTLPPNFTDVVSPDGFVTAGDGRGGTLMNYGVTFVSGLTEPVAEVSYTATVSDAVIPPVTLSVLPVVVEDTPSATAQLAALQGGVESGQELASNGELLDENVLALASGAADLVNGILQLNDGAAQLSDGLVNTAVPGANQLADGLDQLNGQVPALVDGVGQLDAGGTELSDGLNQLDAQVPALVDGVGQLDAGGTDLSDGLNQLDAQVPALVSGVSQLDDGAQQLQAGLLQLQGSLNGSPTFTDGVDQLVAGAQQLDDGLKQLKSQLAGPPSLQQAVDALLSGAQQVSTGLNDLEAALDGQFGPGLGKLATDLTAAAGTGGLADQVVGGIAAIKSTPDCGAQACQPTADGVTATVNATLRTQVQDAADGANQLNDAYNNQIRPGIQQLSDGVDRTDPANPGLVAGLTQLQGLVPQLVGGVDQLAAGSAQLLAGLKDFQSGTAALPGGVDQLVAGANQLADGLSQLSGQTGPLASGVDQLATGANQLSAGLDELNGQTAPLASGVEQLADGGNQLAAGLDELNGQTGPLASGVEQLADGGNQLADGLLDAAGGSVQLADGADQLAEAAPALPQGAERLSAEGTSQLVEAGEETAQGFGERVALVEAAAERTADGGLPYGGPEDAIVAAAYRYDLEAATGRTAQNTGRLVGAAVVAGAAAVGAGLLARRRTA